MRVRPQSSPLPLLVAEGWKTLPTLLGQVLPLPLVTGSSSSAELAQPGKVSFWGATWSSGPHPVPAGATSRHSSPASPHQGPRYSPFSCLLYLSLAQATGWREGLIRACQGSASVSQGEKCCLCAGCSHTEESYADAQARSGAPVQL